MKIDELSQLLDTILDDLSARFIINLPEGELSSVTRICFGLEQAHWFYEDFFRPLHPALPSVNLRAFTAALFSHCPLLWKFSGEHEAAFEDFLKYKTRVPVRGAIMLNKEMTKCVLVKGWKASAGWGFPKGKIDEEEDDADCAVREVFEECGFDIKPYLNATEYVDRVMKEQKIRLYVVHGIPEDTKFETQTRKEISKIDWFYLNDLPTYKNGELTNEQALSQKNNKFYMVAPFLAPLRKWIKRNKKTKKSAKGGKDPSAEAPVQLPAEIKPESQITTASDLESSSRALKLLLGVNDEVSAHHGGNKISSKQLDLTTLFRQSSHELQESPPTKSFDHMNIGTNIALADREKSSPDPYMMQQKPSASEPYSTYPLHGRPPQGIHASRVNPNASSLLAILSPATANPSQDMYIARPPPYPDQSTRQRLPVIRPFLDTIGAPDHKQSLLSILKPTTQQTPASRPSNDNDTFLMQYLLDATQQGR